MKKVNVEIKIPDDIESKSDKECVKFVHGILLGVENYPLIDPCRPYVGGMVNISCGSYTETCSVFNK